MNVKLILCIFILNIFTFGNSANILGLCNFPSKSHAILSTTLLKAVAKRGHNVTMISAFPLEKKIPNYNDIEIKELIEIKDKYLGKLYFNLTSLGQMKAIFGAMPILTEELLNHAHVKNLLKSNMKFDAMIITHPLSEQLFGIAHHFNVPLIVLSLIGTNPMVNYIAGNMNPYSYVPNLQYTFTDKMSFVERLINTVMGLSGEIFQALLFPIQKSISAKYFPSAPPLEDIIEKHVALILVNSHYTTESPRPYTPNLIQIGGFHLEDIEPINSDLQKYLDSANDGLIYFSFGSNIPMSKLPKDKLEIMLKCLSKLKEKVLWKFESNDFPHLPENVRIEKWLPQRSILRHPNVKAFITHGGMGSILEAIHAGVPMLAMPFFGDQTKNVADAINAKYAISYNFNEVNEETFAEALDKILHDPIYKESIKKISSHLRDQPINPMDKAMYWIEHVIKYKGAEHLKPASTKLNTFQQLNLDVFGFLIVTIVLIFTIIYYILKCMYCLCCRKRVKNVKKPKTS